MIRTIEERDAAAFVALSQTLDSETRFMLFEPGERTTTEAEQRARITGIRSNPTQLLLVAEDDDKLVGFLGATRGSARRNRHCASLVMGVLASAWGRGIGSALLVALVDWAHREAVTRLELTVVAANERARHLYEKHDFLIEGTKRGSLRVDGVLVDEYLMARTVA